MLPWCDCYAPVVGRILMGGYFLWSSVLRLASFGSTVALVAAAGVPSADSGAAVAIGIELCLGTALLLGWHTRNVALALVVLTALTAFMFETPFLEVLAIMGGLLYMSSFGSGGWSVGNQK